MNERIKKLIGASNICVLSTVSENKPYCSLMAYVPSEDCTHIYLVTSRSTRKYQNVLRNPHVSLLIDNRCLTTDPVDEATRALTITGTCRPLEGEAVRGRVHEQFLERQPHVTKLVEHPDSDILEVSCEAFLLLDGVMESYFERVEPEAGRQ